MNPFVKHHARSIRFVYSCFDRILLNGIIQPLQWPASVVWFFHERDKTKSLTRAFFRSISNQYHQWVQDLAKDQRIPLENSPEDRNEQFVERFYRRLRSQPGIAVILKNREPSRLAVSVPTTGHPHIKMDNRFVQQYYFYIRDEDLGRMFIRVCPYFPFNVRVCINGHEWLANCMRKAGIQFRQAGNAFLSCADPSRLQQLSDQFNDRHITEPVGHWLKRLIPFFRTNEQQRYAHRLFMSQVEYCTNIIFHRRVHLDRMADRLIDLNRTIGRPDRMSFLFGKRIYGATAAGVKTKISHYHLANPVIRSEYKKSAVKQYVRDHLLLRTEALTNNTRDLDLGKSIANLHELREKMGTINARYLHVQQDVLESFIDRGHLEQLAQPTVSPRGRRTPGLKLDDRRVLAVMQALTRFAHLSHGGQFRTRDLHAWVADALGRTTDNYTLGQLRYDLSKVRAKGLVERIEGTQRYRITSEGYRLCILFLKLRQRIYAPLTSATISPSRTDIHLSQGHRCTLDRLYVAVDHALNDLFEYVRLRPAA